MSSLLDNSKLNKLVTELCKGFLMEGRGSFPVGSIASLVQKVDLYPFQPYP